VHKYSFIQTITMGQREILPVKAMKQKYEMQKKLGGGAFGNVYLILRLRDDQLMAAKHQRLKDERERRYARREVEILDMMVSDNTDCRENIIQMIDYYESARECVILTEYLTGGELFERISSRHYDLTEAKCKGFMRQVLLGLRYMHNHGRYDDSSTTAALYLQE